MLRFTSVLFASIAVVGFAFPADDPAILKIGMTASLMEDTPASQRDAFAREFTKLVHDFTGLRSVNLSGLDPWTSAKQVEDGQWDVGVFQGVEFAWVQPKFTNLQPFMVATQGVALKAVLVAGKDAPFKSFADFKGKDAMLLQGRLHCQLFADKSAGGKANQFFGKLLQDRSWETVLDAILLNKVQAAIVDSAALEDYKDLSPGRYRRLKIVAESVVFPPAAIVSAKGVLSDKLLMTMKDGMAKANKSDRGRETLTAFHVKKFEATPADYDKELAAIRKAYPSPKK